MRGRRLFGCWALLLGSLALGSTPAGAGGDGCCWRHRVYTLPLLFSNPVQTSFVYYPSYRLNYFRIEEEGNRIVIDYVTIPKTPERELTWLQRLVTLGKTPKPQEAIPAKTIVDF